MRRGEEYKPTRRERPHPSVAVVVVGFNGAAFLPSCLDSILCQSHRPDEIVFVDDASTDDSVAIARRWGKGVKVVERTERGGQCEARNAGAEATTSTLLLFVDCDNILPPDYLITMLEDLGSHTFVYPGKRFFGEPSPRLNQRGQSWEPPEAKRADLWRYNYADTCSLMQRSAFQSAGGWIQATSTASDWHLFLRLSRIGSHARSRAVLDYRIHPANWSINGRRDGKERNVIIRKTAATITVATVYSGRMPGLWTQWLRAVTDSLQYAGKKAELIVMDASPQGLAEMWGGSPWSAIQVRRLPGADAVARRKDGRATAEFLAGAFNGALDASTGDVLWCIEDDTVPPLHACAELLDALMREPRTAVGGVYRNRHRDDGFIAHNVSDDGKTKRLAELPDEPFEIDLTGTGCLMLNKDLLQGLRWQAECRFYGRAIPSHDWHFSWALKERGEPVLLLPGVLCRHHQTEDVWV